MKCYTFKFFAGGKGNYQCWNFLHALWHAEGDAWDMHVDNFDYHVQNFNMIQVLCFL